MIIPYWHKKLNMPKKSLDWHIADIADEIQELKEAKGFIARWSELSDVAYAYTRTKYSGHKIKRPLNLFLLNIGFIYMIPKMTLRWHFYHSIAKNLDKNVKMREIRNPKKLAKLEHIAHKYNLDPETFRKEVEKKLKKVILLK